VNGFRFRVKKLIVEYRQRNNVINTNTKHKMSNVELDNYNHILDLPIVRDLLKANKKLKRRNKELKQLIRLIGNNVSLLTSKNKSKPVQEEEDDDEVKIIQIKKERKEVIVIDDDTEIEEIEKCIQQTMPYNENIVYEIVDAGGESPRTPPAAEEDEGEIEEVSDGEGGVFGFRVYKSSDVATEAATEEEDAVAASEAGVATKSLAPRTPPAAEEEEEEATEEEEAEEEEATEEEATEEEATEEEATEEEATEEEATEEEATEEEATEEEEAEEEEEGASDPAEGGVRGDDSPAEEVYEVTIKGKSYYTSNEKNGTIYGLDENGDVSLEVGVYKAGKPTFF
jgi:hypothetical protein